MQLTENPLCTFCQEENKTTEHLFWNCDRTSSFILDCEHMFLANQFFSKQDMLFGSKLLSRHLYNFLILHLKYYFFAQKIASDILDVAEFFL